MDTMKAGDVTAGRETRDVAIRGAQNCLRRELEDDLADMGATGDYDFGSLSSVPIVPVQAALA